MDQEPEIPDFAEPMRLPCFALGDNTQRQDLSNLQEIATPEITREMLIGQLYLEAMDKRSKNQPARVRALETIAKLKGWIEVPPTPDEDEDNTKIPIGEDEAVTVARAFADNY